MLHEWRGEQSFEVKKPVKQFEEKCLDMSKKILNMEISSDEKFIYLLMRDSINICSITDCKSKRIIKYDPIDAENVNLPTPLLIINK